VKFNILARHQGQCCNDPSRLWWRNEQVQHNEFRGIILEVDKSWAF